MIPSAYLEAAGVCLNRRYTFALYALPDSDEWHFLAPDPEGIRTQVSDIECTGKPLMFVNTFGNRLQPPACISSGLTAADAINTALSTESPMPDISPCSHATTRADYIRNLTTLIAELRSRGEAKTVISRAIASRARVCWTKVAEAYFSRFPSTFRFLYYTPFTGAWLGASPEVLATRTYGAETVRTMALAGTRRHKTHPEPWDAKNLREHMFVVDYIAGCMQQCGARTHISEAENLKFGTIEHLCHRIEGHYSGDMLTLLDRLSPTPALGGIPMEYLMSDLERFEGHPRHCYGGYIGISDSTGVYAYVNLRSVHFDADSYCIYAGGGITPDSNPDDEWEEAEAKSSILHDIILSNYLD